MQMKFATALFGYSKKQVNEAIAKLIREHEDSMALRNERFMELRDQNNIMKAELSDYRRKELNISSVLIKARELATEMVREGEQSALQERRHIEAELHQLEGWRAALFQNIDESLQEAADIARGYEQQLKELRAKRDALPGRTDDDMNDREQDSA